NVMGRIGQDSGRQVAKVETETTIAERSRPADTDLKGGVEILDDLAVSEVIEEEGAILVAGRQDVGQMQNAIGNGRLTVRGAIARGGVERGGENRRRDVAQAGVQPGEDPLEADIFS